MHFTLWYIIVGLLLVGMALAGTLLKRLPLSTSMLYLLVGIGLGPAGAGLIRIDAIDRSALLERVTEVAVIVSLFTAGLKMRLPLRDKRWWLPVRLATVSMAITVGLIAAAGWLAGLPIGVAVLLGAILAPTDPVLASDVQLEHPADRDRLRFSLTGEAGFNDGTAFPFVMLGLGLLGVHDLGTGGWKWLAVDVLWAITAGLAIGAVAGTLVARLVIYLRKTHKEALGLDEFLSLGLIALAYGLSVWVHAYGFLAAFAAGVALRRVESMHSGGEMPAEAVSAAASGATSEDVATNPDTAPAYMAQAVLGFNQQIERITEVAVVVIVGGLLTTEYVPAAALWLVPLLLLVIRPMSVLLGLTRTRLTGMQRGWTAWFGVRGVGSIYYLMFALQRGLNGDEARLLTGLTLTTVATSIVVHGISVTPMMKLYERTIRGSRSK